MWYHPAMRVRLLAGVWAALFGLWGVNIPGCTEGVASDKTKGTVLKSEVVVAGCGQCQLGMNGGGCDLAIRYAGKNYWVDGTDIDDHGDAHGEHGFCNARSTARVSGTIRGGRFYATSFTLAPATEVSEDEASKECEEKHSGSSSDASCECHSK